MEYVLLLFDRAPAHTESSLDPKIASVDAGGGKEVNTPFLATIGRQNQPGM